MKLRCYCGEMIAVTEEDLGFEELECPKCGLTSSVPETPEDLERLNQELLEAEEEATSYRVMVEGEDGHVFCACNGLPNDDLLQVLLDGFRVRYPEARRVFTEIEEDYKSIDVYSID